MQLMPSKAKKYGVKNRLNAAQNIDGGVHLLHDLFEQFGDLDLVLAAYNAGENAVLKHGGIPPYRETGSFVKHVKALEAGNARL